MAKNSSFSPFSIDTSKILLTENGDTVNIKFQRIREPLIEYYQINYPWKDSSTYRIELLPNAFTSHHFSNDTTNIIFNTRGRGDYNVASLKLKDGDEKQAYVVQLFDEKDNLVIEKYVLGNDSISYQNLLIGKYKLKLIYDDNKNSKWDTGEYLKKSFPEKVLSYKAGLEVISRGESEVIWEIE